MIQTPLLWTTLLVAKMSNFIIMILYNTDNSVMQTFGSVPLLSVLLLEAYMYLNSKVEYYALILYRINTRRQ